MLLRRCLIHIVINTRRHVLYVSLFLSMSRLNSSYLFDLIFIFSLIFIAINHITSLKQAHLFLVHFFEYLLLFLDDKVDEESE